MTFALVASLIPVSLFLKAGFVSVSVIWFVALCLYRFRLSGWPELRRHSMLLLPILLFATYAVGLFFSDSADEGFNLVLRKIHLLALPLAFILVTDQINTDRLANIIMGVFMMTTLLASVWCLMNATANAVISGDWGFQQGEVYYSYFSSHLLSGTLDLDPVYLSLFCNFSLLVLLASSLFNNPTYKAIVAMYLLAFILLCGSTAGTVCGIAIVTIWFPVPRYAKMVGPALVSVVILWLVIESDGRSVMFKAFSFTYANDKDELSDYRANKLVIWESAVAAVAGSPIFGYGTADGQRRLNGEYQERKLDALLADSLNAHNQFLTTMLDLGVIGLISLILMIVVPLVVALRSKNLLLVGFLLMLFVFFCVESVLLRQKGIVFVSFFYSVLILQLLAVKPEDPDK